LDGFEIYISPMLSMSTNYFSIDLMQIKDYVFTDTDSNRGRNMSGVFLTHSRN